MRRTSLILGSLLALALFACAGETDEENTKPNDKPDAGIAVKPDAAQQSIDAATDPHNHGGADASTTPTTTNAHDLGKVCNGGHDPQGDCPAGYTCLVFEQGKQGFCSIPCQGPQDRTTCSNHYQGPGMPVCYLGVSFEENGPVTNYCGILCGAQFDKPDDCPTGMACTDQFKPGAQSGSFDQGTDGKNDSCAIP
ncbi:MAG: hypothetical protein HY698_06025 [Deltaproteobacteria bacterium]|nr:hypothetical protein [Deltaproteobacteria bacterium]